MNRDMHEALMEQFADAGQLQLESRELRAENAKLRELLQEHEWCGMWRCPKCGADRDYGHNLDCPLAAALKGGQQ